jgi:valyl-tRNA synthetase
LDWQIRWCYSGAVKKKLGASCAAETKFTMDPDMSASVIRSLFDLYNKGLIYRGYRMVKDQKKQPYLMKRLFLKNNKENCITFNI